MAEVTLGKIASHPNKKGEHTLKCPRCSAVFLSPIRKDEKSGALQSVVCTSCKYSDEPKVFVATAHHNEAMKMVNEYVQKELQKSFKKIVI